METRKASLNRRWEPLTDDHERELGRANQSLDQFQDGSTVDPLALVGAYRSGKTQLLYHLFTEAWERGIPAFYVGDPEAMLEAFAKSDATDLNKWIESKLEEQLEAYADEDPAGVEWFPNIDSKSKREFIESHSLSADRLDSDEVIRTALLFDEVEQSYRAFIQAMDKDDDNPLRKINDGLQDTFKVWSFGMISAFEFIGEADWGRMKEIRIPPLSVSDVRRLLQDRAPEAVGLANTIWWLSRGRTGIIIKLIDQIPSDPDADAHDWIRQLAEADFKDTRLINNLWTELNREEWDDAITALLFRPDGLESWRIRNEQSLTAEQVQTIAVSIIQDEYSFDKTDSERDAQAIIDRNTKRVVEGLAVGEDQLFPQLGLSEAVQAEAFLDLISNMTVSFEPASEERQIAIDALDTAKELFETQWIQRATKAEHQERQTETAAPERIRDAFPPIAVNPERVSERPSEELEQEMERGFELVTGTVANESVGIRFCPTESTFESEILEITNGYDLTNPTVLIVPEDEEFEFSLPSEAKVYQQHNLLRVEEYQSNRLWSFITNLFGRLQSEDGFGNPYYVDNKIKQELLGQVSEREVRNTIETLYDQLYQVADDETATFAETYRETYSLANTDSLLWQEERLDGDRPYWSNGRWAESTIALSYLPVFGPDYESQREYTKLHRHLELAIESNLVSGTQTGFSFKEYFSELFTQNGYSGSVESERAHYRENGQIAPAVQQTQSTLTALSQNNDVEDIIDKVDDPDVDVSDGDVPVVGVPGLSPLGYGLVRALLVRGLTTGPDPEIDVPARLDEVVDRLETQQDKIEQYIENVETLDENLVAPEIGDLGEWIDIRSDRLDLYQQNLNSVIQGATDLKEKCQADSTAAPLGYHYWLLVTLYLDDIADEIDDLHTAVTQANADKIVDAIRLFETVYTSVEESEAVPMYFDSREAVLSDLWDYGEEIFHLERRVGATSLSIPEDSGDLNDLNDEIGDHREELSQMDNDLQRIEEQSETVRDALQENKDKLRELLSGEEVIINE